MSSAGGASSGAGTSSGSGNNHNHNNMIVALAAVQEDSAITDDNIRNGDSRGTSAVHLLSETDPNNPNSKNLQSIKLGETIRFEAMGPIIINMDGTYLLT
jgi:hypothetical protein